MLETSVIRYRLMTDKGRNTAYNEIKLQINKIAAGLHENPNITFEKS